MFLPWDCRANNSLIWYRASLFFVYDSCFFVRCARQMHVTKLTYEAKTKQTKHQLQDRDSPACCADNTVCKICSKVLILSLTSTATFPLMSR